MNGSFCKNEQKYTHSCSLKCSLRIGDGYESEWMDFPIFESNCFCYSKEIIGECFGYDEWTESAIRARYEDFNNNSEKAFKVKEYGLRFICLQRDADVRMCCVCLQRDATLQQKRCFKDSESSRKYM